MRVVRIDQAGHLVELLIRQRPVRRRVRDVRLVLQVPGRGPLAPHVARRGPVLRRDAVVDLPPLVEHAQHCELFHMETTLLAHQPLTPALEPPGGVTPQLVEQPGVVEVL